MLGRKMIYVRCINCSYNKVAKGMRLLDKNAFFVYTGNLLCKLELLKDISTLKYLNIYQLNCRSVRPSGVFNDK